ncbi:DNAJ protein JJJ1 homolog [Cryptomeria japonica]|uniref:DNAJ protein JJJ1 homolog n=1 Tax=Cryptomeria japonica TaxID=3369 RepID=UPI0027DA8D6D|nr:DNAJ protein JJJ1 homolog [Cryptomeria japonica]
MATDAPQRCLYEILGIERSCSSEEIRAAYKKLALKLHPDKHKGDEAATARFQELQRAYEVLSDPRERSWYDNHRSQILFSSSSHSSTNTNFSDFDINLWPYFSTCAYSGYGDSGKGFFRVYGQLFEKLFQQEIAFAHAMEAPAVADAPLMGNLDSPYAQVSAFYNYWLGFCTVKDFSWVDEYRASAGPNRKVRRLMEEENKKLRKKAKREYNETVRELAEFVKKRDKRVLDRQVQRKKEQDEKRALANLRRKQLEKERLDKAARYQEQEWTTIVESDNDADQEDWGDDKKASGNQELYCIVCSKRFKSDKQWKNHEQSKKHKDRLVELRDSFVQEDNLIDEIGISAEDDAFGLDINSDGLAEKEFSDTAQVDDLRIRMDKLEVDRHDSGDSEEDDQISIGERQPSFGSEHNADLRDASDKSSYHSFIEDENTNAGDVEHEMDNNQMDDEDSVLAAMLKTHRNKQKSNKVHLSPVQIEKHDSNSNYNANAEETEVRKPAGFEPSSSNFAQRDADDGIENDVGGSPMPAQQQGSKKTAKRKKKQAASSTKHYTTGIADGVESRSEDKEASQQQKVEMVSNFSGDRQADTLEGDKRDPKSSAKQSAEHKSAKASSKGKKGKAVAKFSGHKCETCGEEFDSRNQVFAHLSETGHSRLKSR